MLFILFFLCAFTTHKGNAQLSISHEVGVLVGPASFFTDYGERWNIQNNLSNAGLGIGLVHYMNFAFKADCNCYASRKLFSEHFKIRTEIDYFTSKLEHFGPVAAENTQGGQLLRAMHGESHTIEIGAHLEYYPFNIRDFRYSGYRISPYISLGAHYVYYNPNAYSDLGDLTNPKNVFPTFIGGMDFEGGSTWAIAGSLGTRYRMGRSSDLVFEGRWHYYHTDWLDGLNIDAPQNKFKDFIFWLNVGYIYHFGF